MIETPSPVSISGIGISPGFAVGEIYVYSNPLDRDIPFSPIPAHQVADEWDRLERAIARVSKDLQTVAHDVARHMDGGLGGIFEAHDQILKDPTTAGEIRKEVESTLVNAECAVQRVFRRWEQRFVEMERRVAGGHAGDFADLGRRLLRALLWAEPDGLQACPPGRVLVARRLLPSEAMQLKALAAAALVVEEGGPGSHCALLTRAIGIPAVVAGAGLLGRIRTGELMQVDGNGGVVIIHPTQEQVHRCREAIARRERAAAEARATCHLPARTRDGADVLVQANVATYEDAKMAARHGADGIGLYRLEMLYLSRSTLPGEEELYEELVRAARLFPSAMFCVRLLDLGGEKNLPFFDTVAEPNPNLGRRGVRFLRDHPELLRSQLRVLHRLARECDLYVLVPMVTFPDDLTVIRDAMAELTNGRESAPAPRLGSMIETPAAALSIDQLLPCSDFFSIGTNDLTQYMMAADRENPLVARYYQDTHPIMIKLIRQAAAAAAGKLIGVCGELAGKDDAIPLLLQAGIRVLSVAPAFVPQVKQVVRRCSVESEPD